MQSTSAEIKSRQLQALAHQLQVLASRAEQLDRLTVTTGEQATYMRMLGTYHASWFMAAGRVMTPAEEPPVDQA
ncbi:hypothetical protein MNV49_004829 [Pseudohyphozyma bogoriensis]|nr:hypothetical protein MNV49_004829 [Pseudohyphozyma bogoriensis]